MLDKRYLTLSLLGKTKSYTETAKRLFMTQPAISQQIKSLEDELELQLVIYDRPKLTITRAGEQLIAFVDTMQSEAAKILAEISSQPHQPTIKVGSTRSLGIFLLPKLIAKLDRPAQDIKTVIGDTSHVLTALREGQIDFGLIEGNFDKAEFDAFPIKNEEFVGVTGAQNAHLTRGVRRMADLLKEPLVIRESGSGTRAIFSSWLATQNLAIADFDHEIEVPSPASIAQILSAGIGVSFMYESLVATEIAQGKLSKIAIADFKISHPINLVCLKNSYFAAEYQGYARLLRG